MHLEVWPLQIHSLGSQRRRRSERQLGQVLANEKDYDKFCIYANASCKAQNVAVINRHLGVEEQLILTNGS